MPTRSPLIVALDLPSTSLALHLVASIGPLAGAWKIGSELFIRGGPEFVRQIRATGASVFLDLKFHDIPNTVARAVAAAVELDVQMLTLHTAGGHAMLEAALSAAHHTAQRLNRPAPLLLGVTILTSLDGNALAQIGMQPNVAHQVERLASLALKTGLQGLVCSPLEITALRQLIPADIQLVTPGIRAASDQPDDQKRTLTAAEAIAAGANWLVVGRPISQAPNPRAAAEAILDSLRPA
jgi:orotidine-5'-phosphate decarboxylase